MLDFDAGEQPVEIGSGEAPLEWLGDLGVVVLEVEDCALEAGQIREVVGLEHLALEDRDVWLSQLAWIGR